MTLSGLTATELARIDSVCLDYESKLRGGNAPLIDDVVRVHGGQHADVLQEELEGIRLDVQSELTSKKMPGGGTTDRTEFAPSTFATPPVGNQGNQGNQGNRNLPVAGTQLGPYKIDQMIGRGGMGVVFSADDLRLGRKVAIKVLLSHYAGRDDLVARFDREARAVAAISHPNIVELFDVGQSDGSPYAVMELLAGSTLEDVLQNHRISPGQVRRIGGQVADALATAHAAGVIHRDLKPQNVMMVGNEASIDSMTAKLFDFGLSRVEMGSDSQASDSDTTEGVVMGTPGYMSPEQAVGEPVTTATDIFAMGCLLHEAFYGKPAFGGKSKSARIGAAINGAPAVDQTVAAGDVGLADLISHCLQKDPADRPALASDVAATLKSTDVNQSGDVSLGNDISRRGWIGIASGGIAVALTGGMIGMTLRARSTRRLHGIHSLAVISFAEKFDDDAPPLPSLTPIGQSQLSAGNRIAGLLVHELTRLPDLIVPGFRPATATSPESYRKLGEELEVDAMLTGTIRIVESSSGDAGSAGASSSSIWELDLQLISSETGTEIWGNRLRTEAGAHLLAQTRIASEISKVIGRELTATGDQNDIPNESAFHCLVDGRMRADPDSQSGLKRALLCFKKAHSFDKSYVDPIAGIALTSITLAAQLPRDQSVELARQALHRADEALSLDRSSVDARLAKVMVDWQMLGRYGMTDAIFDELLMKNPDRWQLHHQYGLYLLATNRNDKAITRLREATLLNTMSMLAKVDLARAYWFSGNAGRAIADATRLMNHSTDSIQATGLLIDIHEQRNQWQKAAKLDPGFPDSDQQEWTGSTYFAGRKKRLAAQPYGAFGDAVNDLIWTSRTRTLDDRAVADFIDPRTPMLALILAAHPSLSVARSLPRAIEVIPVA